MSASTEITGQEEDHSIRLAQTWAGRLVAFSSRSRGGTINVGPEPHHNQTETTGEFHTGGGRHACFHVEAIPDMPGVVAFCLQNTNLYLTNIMYGDETRQNVAAELAQVPGLLADHIGMIVDYAVGRPTGTTNFEGAGFNYSPMTLQRGPPNKLQMFRLEHGIGVKSLFGTYWRSQWWDQTVSQSPHLLGDETWNLQWIHQDRGDRAEEESTEESEGVRQRFLGGLLRRRRGGVQGERRGRVRGRRRGGGGVRRR